MTTTIARDPWNISLELDREYYRLVDLNGPYEILDDMGEILFIAGSTSGSTLITVHSHTRGGRGLQRSTRPAVEAGAFGPHEIDLEPEADGSFTVQLPHIHELCWPKISRSASIAPERRVAVSMAERALSLAGPNGNPQEALHQLRPPDQMRRYLDGHARALINELIEAGDRR